MEHDTTHEFSRGHAVLAVALLLGVVAFAGLVQVMKTPGQSNGPTVVVVPTTVPADQPVAASPPKR
jgi:hypothetical protein